MYRQHGKGEAIRPRERRALITAACALLIPVLAGQTPDHLTPAFNNARKLYFEGADGNSKAYSEAGKLFADLYEHHPKVPRIQVYYGSLRLLEASHTWVLWKKYSLSKQGVELMDQAVGAVPQDLEVRFVRAATTFELPAVFHRREQCAQDFAYLAQHAEQAAQTGALEPRLAAASFYFHGEFLADAKQEHKAEAAWRQAIAIAPESRAARDSRHELAKEQG